MIEFDAETQRGGAERIERPELLFLSASRLLCVRVCRQ
jgi:hypothetical protein